MNEEIKAIQTALAAPFEKVVKEKTYSDLKWLPTSAVSGGKKMMCTAYLSRAQVIDRLNSVLGIHGWQFETNKQTDGSQIGTLSIKLGDDWISKSDIGTKSNTEAEKGAVSDALKRAATLFGVGAYIYKLPTKFISATKGPNGKAAPCDDKGRILYGNQLHDYINGFSTKQGVLAELLMLAPELYAREEIKALWNELKTL